eukprot:510879-Rhodomonas_salina.1
MLKHTPREAETQTGSARGRQTDKSIDTRRDTNQTRTQTPSNRDGESALVHRREGADDDVSSYLPSCPTRFHMRGLRPQTAHLELRRRVTTGPRVTRLSYNCTFKSQAADVVSSSAWFPSRVHR